MKAICLLVSVLWGFCLLHISMARKTGSRFHKSSLVHLLPPLSPALLAPWSHNNLWADNLVGLWHQAGVGTWLLQKQKGMKSNHLFGKYLVNTCGWCQVHIGKQNKMDTILALEELTIWENTHGSFNLKNLLCTVNFQLDYSEGVVLTFSVTSVPQTSIPVEGRRAWQIFLENSFLPP